MKEEKLALHDPIAALATPLGKSAIAVIRTSGEGVIGLIDKLFVGKNSLSEQGGHTIAHGRLVDPATDEKIDEVLTAVYRAPHSYTGEDAIELFCHGGIPTIVRVIALLRSAGFRDAAPGEFSLRAFAAGKMDLTAAEAVNEITSAESDKARGLALERLSGVLRISLDTMKKKLVDVLSGIEAMIDYPDEAYEHKGISQELLTDVSKEIGSLLETYSVGKVFQEGAVAVIAGRTNAGKSTLFNLLVKEDRSIVSDLHGTTRDFIEAAITVSGIPIRLFDTAGLRPAEHPLEQESIRRTERLLENASLVIYVVDATSGLTVDDEKYTDAKIKNQLLIKVWNKVDVAAAAAPPGYIRLSAVTREGLSDLEEAIERALVGDFPASGEALVIDSLRQKEALEKTRQALAATIDGIAKETSYDLIAADLREAIDGLGAITGEVTSAEILAAMFSKFCVGK